MNEKTLVGTRRGRGVLRLTDIIPSSTGVEFVKKIIDTLEPKIQDSMGLWVVDFFFFLFFNNFIFQIRTVTP